MAEQSIKVNATLHQSEIAEMGKCKGKRNNTPIMFNGDWRAVGGIKFIRFCSLKFDVSFQTYHGIAEFLEVDTADDKKAHPVAITEVADIDAGWDQAGLWDSANGDDYADFTVLMNAVE